MKDKIFFRPIVITYILILFSFSSNANNQIKDTLFFKGNIDFPPYQLIDEHGKNTGFCVEIFNLVTETMGLNVELELGPWDVIRTELEKQEIDGLIAMSYSAERSKTIHFTNPYIYVSYEVFVRKGSPIQSLKDVKDKQAIVIKGDIMHDYLINNNITNNVIPVKDYETAVSLLSSGRYDCALINELQGRFIIDKNGINNVVDLGNPFESKGVCFALSEDNQHLMALLNDGIDIIIKSGEFDKIYDKWFAHYERQSFSNIKKYVIWSLIPVILIIIISFLWVWSLRKQVSLKTKQLQHQLNKRQKFEDALQHEKSLLDSLINSIPDLIFYKDRNNTYLGCNKAFSKFSGLTQTEIIGKNDFDIYPFEEARKYSDNDKELINNRNRARYETWERNIEGKKALLDVLKVPFLDKDGTVLGMVGICHDITNRHYIEEELKNAKIKAEESDKLKSAFLANMSHEIRTPMNAIIGFSDLLVNEETDAETREELASHINNNCNTLIHLIDDIIDIAQIEANELKFVSKKVDILFLLNEFRDYYQEHKSQENKGNIELRFPENYENKKIYVDTDPYRLRQIFTNLLDNAFKFTETGFVGIDFILNDEKKVIEFIVKDSGIGIPKEYHAFIFHRFRKYEENDKLYRGTGLGLAITKNLIEKMGGKIWVNSEKGKGAEFHFTLPIKGKSIKIDENEKELTLSIKQYKGKKILIAEDEISNFKYLNILLKKHGLNISHAKNGSEAVDMCMKNKYDLVLMDIKMPLMDGIEATKRIKDKFPNIPIIAQTAYAMQDDKTEAIKAGCNDYLTKPINKQKLRTVLETWFKNY